MNIAEINSIAAIPNADAGGPRSLKEAAAEFDAMVWELVLRESGFTRAFESDEDGGAAPLGDLFVRDMARQLAQQIDVGFGRMALASATQLSGESK